jgi:type VI secretion system protein ImpH
VATPSGTRDLALARRDLETRLQAEPFCFEFFQAVRLLERFSPARKPAGRFYHPATEAVRFGAHPSLSFPASEIQSLVWREAKAPMMTVNFIGLFGPQGVLPLYYTELVMERLRERDTTMRDFFDLFNHRIISLFYQAWEKHRLPIAHEQGEMGRFSQLLLALIGLGTPGLQQRQKVPDDSLIFYGGLLAQQPRSAAALRQLLTDYFGIPVEIEQFVGSWCRLDPETQCRMEEGSGYSDELGVGAVIGDEVWEPQSRVRIKLGPLSLTQYLGFLPDGTAYAPLKAITKFFSGDGLDFEVQLILERRQAPPCELGAEGDAAPRLGWVTWMKSAAMGRDPADTVLRL